MGAGKFRTNTPVQVSAALTCKLIFMQKRREIKIRRMAGRKWNEVLENLTQSYKPFLSSIDRHNLVSFCVDNKHIRSAVCKYLHNFKKTNAKSTAHSLAKYKQGQKLYSEDKYNCVAYYNASIAYANKDDSSLADVYNSRSLVLYELGLVSESLRDIEMALEHGYGEDSEVILRKARSLVKLGIVSKAEDVLDSSKLKEEIKKLKKESDLEKKLPELKGGENENYACASSYINVFYNAEKGRHVIANHDIHPGDVLFIERPFAFVPLKVVCRNCCKKIAAPIFCWECKDAIYCSSQCRDDDQKTFHRFECGFGDLFSSIGIAHLSLKIILKASSNINELKKILSSIKEIKYEDGMVPCKNTNYEAIYNLVNHIDKFQITDLFQYSVTALLFALYLRENTCYMSGASASAEDLKFLTGVILRHILQLLCNSYAIIDTFCNVYQTNGIFTETEQKIGTAIYSSSSFMNHSCRPSITYSFYNKVLVVRAIKEVKKGEEVYSCYGPDARRMERSERQEILRKQYFFTCRCVECIRKHDIQEFFTAFKCPECAGAFIPEYEDSANWICAACRQISKISNELLQKEISFYSLLEEGRGITDENMASRLRTFLKLWQLGREIFYKFHSNLAYVADEIARCLANMEDYRRCIMFLRCSVLSVEKRFGSFSIESAKEMKKLGDAYLRYFLDCQENMSRETAREGLLYYEKAEKVIGVLYGPDHQEMKEIRSKKQILQAPF